MADHVIGRCDPKALKVGMTPTLDNHWCHLFLADLSEKPATNLEAVKVHGNGDLSSNQSNKPTFLSARKAP